MKPHHENRRGPDDGQGRHEAPHITINADADAGQIQVAILDEQGNCLNGYSFDEFKEISTDSIKHNLSWAEVSIKDLRTYKKSIQLEFRLSGDAKLYGYSILTY